MGKLQVVLLGMVFGLLTLVSTASALPPDFGETRWELSGQLGAIIPIDDDADPEFNMLGRATYDLTPNIAVGATTGWHRSDVEASGAGDLGDLHGIPLFGTVVLKLPLEAFENRLVPYAVAGIGVVFWNFDETSGNDIDDDTTFAGQLGLGVDYYVTDRIAVFGEASYLFSEDIETDGTFSGIPGTLIGEVQSIFVGGGLKARF